jgi:hypothetical protein
MERICLEWGVDSATKQAAFKTLQGFLSLQRVSGSGSATSVASQEQELVSEQIWLICALHIAVQTSTSRTTQISLAGILKMFPDVSLRLLTNQLRRVNQEVSATIMTPVVAEHFEGFTHLLMLTHSIFTKYSSLFRDKVGEVKDNSNLLGSGWLLYLNAKAQLSLRQDLYDGTLLLFCVIDFLMSVASKVESDSGTTTQASEKRVRMLTNNQDNVFDEVRKLQVEQFNSLLHESDTVQGAFQGHEALLSTSILLAELYDSFLSHISMVQIFWVDERLWLRSIDAGIGIAQRSTDSFSFGGAARLQHAASPVNQAVMMSVRALSSGHLNVGSSAPKLFASDPVTPIKPRTGKRRHEALSSSKQAFSPFAPVTRTPAHPLVPATPFTRAIKCVSWLLPRVEGRSEHPGIVLKGFFEKLKPNNKAFGEKLLESLVAHITALCTRVKFPVHTQLFANTNGIGGAAKKRKTGEEDNFTMCSRRVQCLKLFWAYLENMLSQEQQRLQQLGRPSNFTSWLSSMKFHSCLLACCVELVVFSYKYTAIEFPHAVHLFELSSWDYIKVLETVVRQDSSMPKQLVARLNRIERQCVEFHCWKSGDMLCKVLGDPKQNYRAWIHAQFQPPSSSSSSSSFSSSSSSDSKSNSKQLSSTQAAILLFFRKVQRDIDACVDILCGHNGLDIPLHAQDLVLDLMRHVLTEKLDMLWDTHLHRIVLCALFAASRVAKLTDITFQKLIAAYDLHFSADSVLVVHQEQLCLASGQPGNGKKGSMEGVKQSNIIKYYNETFVVQLKVFICDVLVKKTVGAYPMEQQAAEQQPMVSMRSSSSGSQVAKGVYLSPMQDKNASARKTKSMTPMTQALYAFGGRNTGKSLDEVNRKLFESKNT